MCTNSLDQIDAPVSPKRIIEPKSFQIVFMSLFVFSVTYVGLLALVIWIKTITTNFLFDLNTPILVFSAYLGGWSFAKKQTRPMFLSEFFVFWAACSLINLAVQAAPIFMYFNPTDIPVSKWIGIVMIICFQSALIAICAFPWARIKHALQKSSTELPLQP